MNKRTNYEDEYVKMIEQRVRPTFYGVGTLKQSLVTKDRIMGDPDIYEGEYRRFLVRLTKRTYGQRMWRKKRVLIANLGTLEGNGLGRGIHARASGNASMTFLDRIQASGRQVRYHLNICLRSPEKMDAEDFIARVQTCWAESPWSMDLKFERRTGNCVRYSLKEGLGTALVSSLSFGPEWIDTTSNP